jgi:histidyl-tRNA synthetase
VKSSKPFRGMKDVLPGEVERRNTLVGIVRAVYRAHGYLEIETPIVESLDVLFGSGGGENEKLTYRLLKRGEKLEINESTTADDLCDGGLRFDLTVPLCRFYAENMHRLPKPFRSIQIGPSFRAERPQKGRYRQFTQADIDIIGDPTQLAEIELITASGHALHTLGLTDFSVRLNDRRALDQILAKAGIEERLIKSAQIALDKLDKLPPQQVVEELHLRGVSSPIAEGIVEKLAQIPPHKAIDAMSDLGAEEAPLFSLQTILQHSSHSVKGMRVIVDPLCVRGLGYYTSTVFEVSHPASQSSIAGGGRYDNMLSRFGLDSPACGISLGFDRILAMMDEMRLERPKGAKRLYLIFDPEIELDVALVTSREYRKAGYLVSMVSHRRGSRSPMKRLATEAEELKRQGASEEFWFQTLGEDQEPRLLMH